jgi:hypothetical protein
MLLTLLPAVSTFGTDNIEDSHTATQVPIPKSLRIPVRDRHLPNELLEILDNSSEIQTIPEISPTDATCPQFYQSFLTADNRVINRKFLYRSNTLIHTKKYTLKGNELWEELPDKSKKVWDQEQRENSITLFHAFNAAISYLSSLLKQTENDQGPLCTQQLLLTKHTDTPVNMEEGFHIFLPCQDYENNSIYIPHAFWSQLENIRIRLELLFMLDVLVYSKKIAFPEDTFDSYNHVNALCLNTILDNLIAYMKRGQQKSKYATQDDETDYSKNFLQILKDIESHCPTETCYEATVRCPRDQIKINRAVNDASYQIEQLKKTVEDRIKELRDDYTYNTLIYMAKYLSLQGTIQKLETDDIFIVRCIIYDILNGHHLLKEITDNYNAFFNNRRFILPGNKQMIFFQGNHVYLDVFLKNFYQYIESKIQHIPRIALAKILGIELSQNALSQEKATAAIRVRGQNSTSSAAASEPQRQGASHKKRKRARQQAKTGQSNINAQTQLNGNAQLQRIDSPAEQSEGSSEESTDQGSSEESQQTKSLHVQGQNSTSSAAASEPQRQGASHKKRKRTKRKAKTGQSNINAQTQLSGNAQPQPQRIDSPEKHREEKQRAEKANKVVELTLSVPSSKQPVDSSAKQSEGSSDESQETKAVHGRVQHSIPSPTPSQQQRGRKTGTSHPKTSTHKQNNNKTQHHNPNHQTFNNQQQNDKYLVMSHEKPDNHFKEVHDVFRNIRKMSAQQITYAIELCETLLKYVFHPSQGMKTSEFTRIFADLKFVAQPNRHGKGSVHHIFPAPDNPLFGQNTPFEKAKINLHFPTKNRPFVYKYFDILQDGFRHRFGLTKEYMEDNLPLLQKRLAHLNSLPASAAKNKGKEKEKEKETTREEEKEKEPEKKKPRSSPNKKNKTNHKHNRKHKK